MSEGGASTSLAQRAASNTHEDAGGAAACASPVAVMLPGLVHGQEAIGAKPRNEVRSPTAWEKQHTHLDYMCVLHESSAESSPIVQELV